MNEYRERALHAWRLAAETIDAEVQRQLEIMARDLEEMAAEVETDERCRFSPEDG